MTAGIDASCERVGAINPHPLTVGRYKIPAITMQDSGGQDCKLAEGLSFSSLPDPAFSKAV